MSSPVFLPASAEPNDQPVRHQAIDPTRSFTVRAPAGSGKTELLIQRYLALLARVQRPEAIVAITFTRKAAGEMLGRVMDALREAHDGLSVDQPHKQITRAMALAALARDREMNWCLLQHAGRLRIQTIDSLCLSIAGEMPWLSRLGAMPRIEEDTRVLYREAARRTLVETAAEHAHDDDALDTVLQHLDNNAAHAQQMIAMMLAKREQWLELAHHSDQEDRLAFESSLHRTIARRLQAADQLIPKPLRAKWLELARFSAANGNHAPHLADIVEWPALEGHRLPVWQQLADLLTTREGWRIRLNKNQGFMPHQKARKDEAYALIAQLQAAQINDVLLPILLDLRRLPEATYSDAQWHVLRALLQTLKLAVAQLRMVFRENSVIDFAELSIAASKALGDAHQPTDLAFRLDSRMEHLLVDEFQDTSRAQFDLLRKLTADWDAEGSRTLFLVGDPMQSIYRFRQAEVGLFMMLEQTGLGALRPQTLQLTTNYRSVPSIVERVNHLFTAIFPQADDMETGAVRYSESQAVPLAMPAPATGPLQRGLFDPPEPGEMSAVTCDFFVDRISEEKDPAAVAEQSAQAQRIEAQCLLERIEDAQAEDPDGSIGILVRARTHLPAIIKALKTASIGYRAVEIDPLNERTVVRDLLSLTRAMLHLADRISWLSILRAPWCGLALDDLEALVAQPDENAIPKHRRTIWECLRHLDNLSDDGQIRSARLRDVLEEAFAQQGRWPLRRWVERTWIKLGGPATITADAEARADADAFLQLLENEQRGADLADLDQFAARVADMMAPPATDQSTVHIMTIHKAKGLEFDTVLLPGLGKPTKQDDDALVLFHEWTETDADAGGHVERLMAPVHETAGEQDPIYKYLKSIEAQKSVFERKRQLYVAMTRAKRRLHLMGGVIERKGGEHKPDSNSMLGDMWPGLTEEEQGSIRISSGKIPNGNASALRLRRLPSAWRPPEMPKSFPVPHVAGHPRVPHEPSFEWVSESLRHAGTVVHALLQSMKPGQLTMPQPAAIRASLLHVGVSPHQLSETAERVQRALRKTLESERGRWILALHDQLRAEYALSAVVDGEIVHGIVDRTFVVTTNEEATRWVVDFKTSSHQGAGLDNFLAEQKRRYRDQMERYAKILRPLGQPVRLGLYFPLLDRWIEWAAADESRGVKPGVHSV